MADNKWIHIDNWMGKILGLKANELLCFAVIYGFTRDGMTEYKCNLSYLASTIFATKQTTFTVLKKLVEQNLILKREEMISGIKYCYYQTNVIYDEGKIYKVDPIKEPLIAIKESLTATIKETLTQYNNKENNKEKDLSKAKSKKGGVSLTPEEQEKEDQFRKVMRERYPRFMMMESPLTYKQSQELKKEYEDDEILQALEEMECWKPLLKKRVDAFRTVKNWINKNREKL